AYARRQDGRIEVDIPARTVPLGLDLLNPERADVDGAAVSGPGLARVRDGIARIGDGHDHGPALWPAADPFGNLLFEEIGATLCKIIGGDGRWLRRRHERPPHRMFRAGIVGEDEAVEAVEPVFRVAAGPGAVLGPGRKRGELRVRGTEFFHRVRVLTRRGEQ